MTQVYNLQALQLHIRERNFQTATDSTVLILVDKYFPITCSQSYDFNPSA